MTTFGMPGPAVHVRVHWQQLPAVWHAGQLNAVLPTCAHPALLPPSDQGASPAEVRQKLNSAAIPDAISDDPDGWGT